MPSPTQTTASRALAFFRGAVLDQAELVFGLVQDVMRERRARSLQQKQLQGRNRAAVMPRTMDPKPAAKKKTAAKPAARHASPTGKKKTQRRVVAPAPAAQAHDTNYDGPNRRQAARDAGEAPFDPE